MRVITFANPKGGTGKTTSALLLAEQLARAGARVGVLDLDPNANILRWAAAREAAGKPTPMRCLPRPARDQDIVATIDAEAPATDYLVVDLEGTRDQVVTYALARTHLCLIPLDGSPMEAWQAADTVRLVDATAAMVRAPIARAVLFTRTNAAFQTADEREVRASLEANGLPILPTRLARRAPYTRLFRDAALLAEMGASDQVAKAAANARDYAQAVANFLTREEAR